jgi:hypothetical protein
MLHRLLGVLALGDSDHQELLQPICASSVTWILLNIENKKTEG